MSTTSGHLSAANWQRTKCYATAVRRADRALSRVYDAALRPTGLNVMQYSLLSLIERAPAGVLLTDLAEAQVIDRTTLTRNLTHLQRDGYISIEKGEDRRQRQVYLTTEGRSAIATGRPLWQKAQDQIENDHGLARMVTLIDELDSLSTIDLP